MARGKLIAVEGLDRAGKSTQCAKLVENLQQRGLKVKLQRYPDRKTPIGHMISGYLRGLGDLEDHVIHLLFSANRWETAQQIRQDIEDGVIVIIDRYIYSGMVYSAAKSNSSLSLEWARKPDEGLPRPDACIFFNISPEEAAKRGNFGEEKYEKKEMQARVRQLYTHLRTATPDRHDFIEIDAGQSIEAVEAAVMEVASRVIKEVDEQNLPLRQVEPW